MFRVAEEQKKSIRGSLSGTHQLQDWKHNVNLQAEVAECYSINFAHLLNVCEIFAMQVSWTC